MQHTKQTCNTANMRCNWYQLDLRLERCARASVPLWATVLAGTLRHHAACSASDRCYRRSLPAWYGPVHANARTHARTLFHTHAHARAHMYTAGGRGGRCHDMWGQLGSVRSSAITLASGRKAGGRRQASASQKHRPALPFPNGARAKLSRRECCTLVDPSLLVGT
jgi:hypothetical protein